MTKDKRTFFDRQDDRLRSVPTSALIAARKMLVDVYFLCLCVLLLRWIRVFLLTGMLLLGGSGLAAAMTCTTHTYYVDGRYVMCQTCCTNGMCQTTCL